MVPAEHLRQVLSERVLPRFPEFPGVLPAVLGCWRHDFINFASFSVEAPAAEDQARRTTAVEGVAEAEEEAETYLQPQVLEMPKELSAQDSSLSQKFLRLHSAWELERFWTPISVFCLSMGTERPRWFTKRSKDS